MIVNLREVRRPHWVKIQIVAAAMMGMLSAGTANAKKIVPLYGNKMGPIPIFEIVGLAQLKPNWAVLAVCNSKLNLEVVVWEDTGSALVRTGSYTSSTVCANVENYTTVVAITSFSPTMVVTAVVPSTKPGTQERIELQSWQVSASGKISPAGAPGVLLCPARAVSIAQLDSNRVVTATNVSDTTMLGDVWEVSSSGNISLKGGFAGSGSVYGAGITALNSSQFVTVSQENSNSDLEVTAWAVNSVGQVSQKGSAAAGYIFFPSPVISTWNSDTVITSIDNGTDEAEVIS